MIKITDFIKHNHISLKAERTANNPYMESSSRMDHYKCLLKAGRSRMTVYFSKGLGHNGKMPDVVEVLDCLALDAASYENAKNFSDWASDFGYEGDSRRAERIFKTVERQAGGLRRLLGDSAYETVLWDVERQ